MSQGHLNHRDSHHLRRAIKLRMIVFAFLQALFPRFQLVKEESDAELEKTSTALRSHNRVHPAVSTSLQLKFSQELPGEVFTGECLVAKGDGTLEVELVDGATGDLVRYGPGTSGKIELVPVEENFDTSRENWTSEDFNSTIVVGEDGRKSLLGKNPYLKMKEGNAPVHGIKFKHTRKWMKKSKFRLGARFVDQFNATRIREAVSEPFIVKDRRGKNKKHYPPSPTDEVWRLINISKGGAFHKRLVKKKLLTVEDFRIELLKNPGELRDILGNISDDMWEATLDHARTCQLNETKDFYTPQESEQKVTGASCSSYPCLSSPTNDLASPSTAFGNSKLQHDKNTDAFNNLTSQPDDLSQDLQRQLRIINSGNRQRHGSELLQTSAADILSHAIASLNALNPSDTDGCSNLWAIIREILSSDEILETGEQVPSVDQQFALSNTEAAQSVEVFYDMFNEYMQDNDLTDAGPSSSTYHQMQHNEDVNPFQNLVSDPGNLINGMKEHLQSVALENAFSQSYQQEIGIDQPSAGVTNNSLGVAANPKRSKRWTKMCSLVRLLLLKKAIKLKRLPVAKKRRLC